MDKIESNYPNCKNLTDEKKKNSKKDFLKNFFDKENFDYDKNLPFYSKFNKNSSVKNMFALKNFNFLENEVNNYIFISIIYLTFIIFFHLILN